MNTRHLRYFVTLAETGHFTRAAEQLHIAQPALSIAIKKLEQHFELQLFHRHERKITLTREGEVFAHHARMILQQVKDAELAMAELRGLEKGEVRLGVPSMLGSYFFPKILMGFKNRYPNIKLTMVEAGTHSIRKKLLSGELDIGVISNKSPLEELETKPILTSQIVALVGENHSFSQKKSISFSDFFKEELVMFKPGYFNRDYIDEICQKHGYTPKLSFETGAVANDSGDCAAWLCHFGADQPATSGRTWRHCHTFRQACGNNHIHGMAQEWLSVDCRAGVYCLLNRATKPSEFLMVNPALLFQ